MQSAGKPGSLIEANDPGASVPPPATLRGAVLFAGAPLAIGMADAALSLRAALAPTYHPPPGWVPTWVFGVVWLVLYPTLGLSAWSVWRERERRDVRGVLAVFAVFFVNGLFFLPIMGAVRSEPLAMTLMDVNGILGTAILAWAAATCSKRAVLWLAPMMVWMPITFALKVWLTVASS